MRASKLRVGLGVALATTLVAVYFAPDARSDAVLLAERSRAASAQPAVHASNAPRVLAIRPRDRDAAPGSGAFAPRQWTPPAPKPKSVVMEVPQAVPAPVAPPLPFRVLGRLVDEGRSAVFLQHNDQNLVVRVGDTIAAQYKVERLEGSTLTLRYLPLNQAQNLDVGTAQ